MLPVSLDCLFLIASSVFSIVYFLLSLVVLSCPGRCQSQADVSSVYMDLTPAELADICTDNNC